MYNTAFPKWEDATWTGRKSLEVRILRDSFRIGTFKKHQDAAMGQSSLSIHRSVEHRFLQGTQNFCREFQAFPSPGTSKYDGQCAKLQVRAAFTAREICSKRRFQCERCVKAIGLDPFYPMLIMLFFPISFCLGSLVEKLIPCTGQWCSSFMEECGYGGVLIHHENRSN
jgi:hypothetical protein